jgi:3-oxoacyl-[acyl-carrier-protein] synthase-3
MKSVRITATGRCFPAKAVPNSYFYEDLGLDTNEEWIRSRTGISERRFVDHAAGESTASLAAGAIRAALAKRGLEATDLDGIIIGTITPDLPFPATACLVQDLLGATNAWAWDVSAACSGYVSALAQAKAFVVSGMAKCVVAVGAETMSSILDYQDRNTCIIFGDGAGATLVEESDEGGEIIDIILHAQGSGSKLLYQPSGGALEPASHATIDARGHYVKQEGRAVFKHAVSRIAEVVEELLARNEIDREDVALVVPHQANIRIIDAAARRLKIPKDRVMVTVEKWANTTAATIPTSLDLALEQGRVKPGDIVVLCTFGAGFTWGAALLQY